MRRFIVTVMAIVALAVAGLASPAAGDVRLCTQIEDHVPKVVPPGGDVKAQPATIVFEHLDCEPE